MGLLSALFGSKPKQGASSNQAYAGLNTAFSPLFGQATQGANAYSGFLNGDSSGFDRYKDMTGFDWQNEQGSRGITGNAAARGLLRSGSSQKALVNYGNNQQQQFAGNYLDRLLAQAGLGFQAGNLVSGAGTTSTQSTSGGGGIGGFLGSLLGGVAKSDRKAKKNIYQIGELPNGLGVYKFQYKGERIVRTGVMADEVAKIQPEALGPIDHEGYQTVNYNKIEGWGGL